MRNVYSELIKISWKYSGKRKFHYALAYFLFVMANLVLLLEPIVIGLFFNHLQVNGIEDFGGALWILALFPLIQLGFWIFHGTARVMERVTAYHIVKNFRGELFDDLTSISLKWHKDNHSGSIMSRLAKASAAIKDFADEGFMYHEVIVKFLGSLIALFIISWQAGVIAVVFGVIAINVIFRFDKLLISYISNINEKWHLYDATFYDYVVNIRTVITLRLEKLAKKATEAKFLKILPVWTKNAKVNELKWFLLTMVIAFLIFTILGSFIFQKAQTGEVILLGTLVALYEYVHKFTGVFYDIAWKYENLVKYDTDVSSLKPIWQASRKRKTVSQRTLPQNWSLIEINNLSFKYEDEKHRSHNLSKVSLELKKGAKIAFIGESGSGKSTLMSLVRGLDKPDKAKVKVDGVPLRDLRELSSQVTLIPQDPEIFENTIEYNLTAGLRHTKNELEEAIEIARFSPVLKRMPKGLKTDIKEKGGNMSGGEKQRLALARGIFAAKNASIVLLDEPTSSVDAKNELAIYTNIFRAFENKCVISSIHRLHLLPLFDVIYFFRDGKLESKGDLDYLLKNSKSFQKIWKSYGKSTVTT